MIAYLDASVLLRVLLHQPDALPIRQRFTGGVASVLVEVECLRALDRLAQLKELTAAEVADRRAACYQLLAECELVELSRTVLRRAGEPFPTPLGTLDAIHLATAAELRDAWNIDFTMATHDKALALGARSLGFVVAGV